MQTTLELSKEVSDLIFKRLQAHYNYIYPRIANKKLKQQFEADALRLKQNGLNTKLDTNLMQSVVEQLIATTLARFENGWSKDYVYGAEKL
jgi:hypothetical protein